MSTAPNTPALPAPYVDPKFLASDEHALADQVQMQQMTGRVAS